MFLASPPLYCHWLGALVSMAAHFLRVNVDFALPGDGRGSSALIGQIATVGPARARASPHTSKFL